MFEPLNYRVRFGLATLFFKQMLIVERVNSGKIILVVTCTADCACHHLKIPGKN